MMGALRTSLQQRRQLRNEHDSVQTEWLLDAGVRLAMQELDKDKTYPGQKVTFKQGLRAGQVGFVEVRVLGQRDAKDSLTVQVDAKLERPETGFEIRRSTHFTVPAQKTVSQLPEGPVDGKP